MIEAYNSFAPWAGEVLGGLYVITAAALLSVYVRFENKETLVIGVYLGLLVVVSAYKPIFWDQPSLLACHSLLLIALFFAHWPIRILNHQYGDIFYILAGLLVLVDSVFLADSVIQFFTWTLAVQLSIINIIFLVMCSITLYACYYAHKNGGKLGKYHSVDQENTEYSEAARES